MDVNRIDRDALFADETQYYRTPALVNAGDSVTFCFRTRKDDVTSVTLLGRTLMLRMEKDRSDGLFDYYTVTLKLPPEPRFYYWFMVEKGRERLFYNRLGVAEPPNIRTETAFEIIPGFRVPEWSKGAVMYQIFIDRFRNGDPDNDTLTDEYSYIDGRHSEHADWDSPVEPFDVHRFYGGDLKGVEEKLDIHNGYAEKLGNIEKSIAVIQNDIKTLYKQA